MSYFNNFTEAFDSLGEALANDTYFSNKIPTKKDLVSKEELNKLEDDDLKVYLDLIRQDKLHCAFRWKTYRSFVDAENAENTIYDDMDSWRDAHKFDYVDADDVIEVGLERNLIKLLPNFVTLFSKKVAVDDESTAYNKEVTSKRQ